MSDKKNIAIFASGTGSNFVSIYNQTKDGNIIIPEALRKYFNNQEKFI